MGVLVELGRLVHIFSSMNIKFLGFALMLALLINPVFAQEEDLLEDDAAIETPPADDIFGGDFFSDLDSFLEDTDDTPEVLVPLEPAPTEALIVDPISNQVGETTPAITPVTTPETLQGSASSLGLPSSSEVKMSVTNVSQDNADATTSGARPGDVLRYEISLNSATEDVSNYVPSINVSGIESVVEFTNTGFGVIENGMVVYPAYSHKAPCTQAFTFFVRVKEDCAQMTALNVSNSEAGNVAVPLNCGLAQTGPSQTLFLLAGVLMLLLTFAFGMFGRSKTS